MPTECAGMTAICSDPFAFGLYHVECFESSFDIRNQLSTIRNCCCGMNWEAFKAVEVSAVAFSMDSWLPAHSACGQLRLIGEYGRILVSSGIFFRLDH